MGAAWTDVKVPGAAVLEIRVRVTMIGACTVTRHCMGSVVGGVPVSGEMQNVLDGFACASTQHQSSDGENDEENPWKHSARSLRHLKSRVKGPRGRAQGSA